MTTPSDERRIKVRLPLRLPVCLHMVNGSPGINSFTENISGDGLYCISPIRFVPHERLTAEVWLPTAGPARCGAVIRCKVRVMRSDALVVGGGFGIGCRIETYTFIAEERREEAARSSAKAPGPTKVRGSIKARGPLKKAQRASAQNG